MNWLTLAVFVGVNAIVCAGLVYWAIEKSDRQRWRFFRKNHLENLLDSMLELGQLFESNIPYLAEKLDNTPPVSDPAARPQYRTDPGTALRRFEVRAREQHKLIRHSLEFGMIGANLRILALVSELQNLLDDLMYGLRRAIQDHESAGYLVVDKDTSARGPLAYQRLFEPLKVDVAHPDSADTIVSTPMLKISYLIRSLGEEIRIHELTSGRSQSPLQSIWRKGGSVEEDSDSAAPADLSELKRRSTEKYIRSHFADIEAHCRRVDSMLPDIFENSLKT